MNQTSELLNKSSFSKHERQGCNNSLVLDGACQNPELCTALGALGSTECCDWSRSPWHFTTYLPLLAFLAVAKECGR